MNADNNGVATVIVALPRPDEQLPSGPLWTFFGDDGDGLVIAGRLGDRQVLLTAWESIDRSTFWLSPEGARAAAAALLAAADHAEHGKVTG